MKILKLLFTGMCLMLSAGLAAQTLEGTWEGTLVTAPGAEMDVQFIVSVNDSGAYSVILTSPTSGALKDIPASLVTVDGSSLHAEFASLSGEYNGSLELGSINGEWQQLDQRFPLALSPYEVLQLSAEELAFLTGTWQGKLVIPGIEVPVVFHFAEGDSSNITGTFDSPMEGAYGLPISNIEYLDAELSFTLDFAGVTVTGKKADDMLDTNWNQAGRDIPLSLEKGEYEAPDNTLTLDEESRGKLLGTWSGQLGPLTLKFKFEQNEEGEFVAFVDSPTQGVNGLLITELTLEESNLEFSLSVPPASYNGELNGNEIAGNWIQNGVSNPLTVTLEQE